MAHTVIAGVQVRFGAGKHMDFLTPNELKTQLILTYPNQLIFAAVLPIIKLSICFTYRRIFASDKNFRLFVDALIVYLFITFIGIELFTILQCTPIQALWDLNVLRSGGSCLDVRPIYLFNGISNIFSDIVLMAIIVPVILRINMSRRQRIVLLSIISLGWLAVVAACVRMARISPFVSTFLDLSWEAPLITSLSAVEVHISLVCAAATSIKPIVVRLLPGLFGPTTLTEVNDKDDLLSRSSSDINVPNGRRSSISRWLSRRNQRKTDLEGVSSTLGRWVTLNAPPVPPVPVQHQIEAQPEQRMIEYKV